MVFSKLCSVRCQHRKGRKDQNPPSTIFIHKRQAASHRGGYQSYAAAGTNGVGTTCDTSASQWLPTEDHAQDLSGQDINRVETKGNQEEFNRPRNKTSQRSSIVDTLESPSAVPVKTKSILNEGSICDRRNALELLAFVIHVLSLVVMCIALAVLSLDWIGVAFLVS